MKFLNLGEEKWVQFRKEYSPDPHSNVLLCFGVSNSISLISPLKNVIMDHMLVCLKLPVFPHNVNRSAGVQETSPGKGFHNRVLRRLFEPKG
jgi:hypothetical protein